MKRKKEHIIYFFIGLLLFSLVSFTVFFLMMPTSSVFAVEIKKNNLGIAISPIKELLKLRNMAPGEMTSAPLTVTNTGKQAFFYNISAEIGSDNKLYNYLDLKITDLNDNEFYSGKLKDLDNLDLGSLGISKHKTFNVAVGLPGEAGNDYQKTFTSMKFILNATANPSSHNCFRPPFGNQNYSMRRGSTTPIKFECNDSDGELLTSSHNVKLVITGRGLREGLTYTLGNGLSFNGGHYQANVYADQNLFLERETYTAIAYIGDQMWGQKTFSTEPGNRSN